MAERYKSPSTRRRQGVEVEGGRGMNMRITQGTDTTVVMRGREITMTMSKEGGGAGVQLRRGETEDTRHRPIHTHTRIRMSLYVHYPQRAEAPEESSGRTQRRQSED